MQAPKNVCFLWITVQQFWGTATKGQGCSHKTQIVLFHCYNLWPFVYYKLPKCQKPLKIMWYLQRQQNLCWGHVILMITEGCISYLGQTLHAIVGSMPLSGRRIILIYRSVKLFDGLWLLYAIVYNYCIEIHMVDNSNPDIIRRLWNSLR